jgi:outer membrane protein assembly factor BamE (lipoprotein component of BamABCDE complex)
MFSSRTLAIVGIAVLVACVTRGGQFNSDAVPKIRVGETTQAQIRRWFGEPLGVSIDSSGETKWRYMYEEVERRDTRMIARIGRSIASIFGQRVVVPPVDIAYENETRHELKVRFDEEGIVRDYSYDRQTLPTRRIY